MEEERQDKINHENKLLYKKMTAILKYGTGTGNVSPSGANKTFHSHRNQRDASLRQETESMLLHYGRSATARPCQQMIRRIGHRTNKHSHRNEILQSADYTLNATPERP